MANFVDQVLSRFRSSRTSPTETIGSTGTRTFGGFIQTIEKNPKLEGREKYTFFSQTLANTVIVASGVRYFLNLVGKAKWRVEPADESAQAQEIASVIEEIMNDMQTPWRRVVRRAAMYRFYGFSIQEWTAKRRDDGSIGMLDIAPRPQITIERWDLQVDGTVFGVIQRSPQTQEEIYLPRSKLVYVVDDALNDSPEGLGLFRHIVEASQRLKRYEELEGFAFETDLRGVPVGRAPFQELQDAVDNREITEEQRKNMEQPLRTFIQKHIKNPQLGILIDSVTYSTIDESARPSNVPKWDVQLLSSQANGQAEVNEAIVRLNREIARVLGVENLLLGDGQGSFALSRDKSNNFALIVDSTLTELEEVFEADFLDPIFQLNGWDPALKPSMKTEAIQYRDIEQVTSALNDMARAGATLRIDDEAVGEVFDLLGLTRPNREEKEMQDVTLIPPVEVPALEDEENE